MHRWDGFKSVEGILLQEMLHISKREIVIYKNSFMARKYYIIIQYSMRRIYFSPHRYQVNSELQYEYFTGSMAFMKVIVFIILRDYFI